MSKADPPTTEYIFAGSGEMAARCRALDWTQTPLGPVVYWPASLRTAAQMVLDAPFPNILLWGQELTQIYNEGYRELMGNKHPAGLGQPTRQCWPEVWHINEPIYQRVQAGESVAFTDALYPITRSGQLQDAWFTLAYSPVRTETGQIGGVLVNVFETTQAVLHRQRSQQALEQSEQRFSLLVRATSEMVYTMSADWQHMLRLDGKEYLVSTTAPNGDWFNEYIPAPEQARVWALIQQAIDQRIPFEAEHQVIRRDGLLGWVFSRAVPILDEAGQIQQWLGAASDITDRKQAQQDLQLHNLWLTLAMRSARAGWGNWDLRTGQAEWSAEGAAIVGFTAQEETRTAEGWLQRIHPDDRSRVEAEAARAMATQTDFHCEYRVIHDSKEVRWLLGTGTMSFDEQGLAYRSTGLVLDITERKQIEAALSQSEERYRTIFTSMEEGFSLLDIQFDAQGNAYDVIIRDANPAQNRIDGVQALIGRRVREVLPAIEMKWIERYAQLVRTGESVRFEDYSVANQQWYEVNASRVGGAGSTLVAITYNDITERKRREANQSLLVAIGDDLARLSTPDEIVQSVGARLGRYLKLATCLFVDVDEPRGQGTAPYGWHNGGMSSLLATYRFEDYVTGEFARSSHAGDLWIIRDTANDPRVNGQALAHLQVGAWLAVPFHRQGRWTAHVTVTDTAPRDWRVDEIQLVRTVAELLFSHVERVRAEAALRQSEARLASIRPLTLLGQTEELAQVGSWEYERATGQFTWSAGMYRLFNYEAGHPLQPEIYLERALPGRQTNAQRLVDYLYQGQAPFTTELQIGLDEQVKTLRISAQVLGEADQQRVLGVALDLTEQLMAQQQLRQTAKNLQAVLDGSPASIGLLKAIHDPVEPAHIIDFQLAVSNHKLAEFFAQPLPELLDQSVTLFARLLWEEDTLASLRHIYHSRESRYLEKQLMMAGAMRWLAISVMRQDDGIVFTGLDITPLKELQTQQQQGLADLARSQQSVEALAELKTSLVHRTDMLRTISHDLRSNLGIISGALHLLGLSDTEQDRTQMMAMVLRNVQQATDLLTNLLDVARLEAGQQQRQVSELDVSELLQQLGQSLQPTAQQQGLLLRLVGPPVLAVDTDRQLLYRIAQNLLINALKYTRQGSVQLAWGSADQDWWLEVSDTGPGLPADLVWGLNGQQPELSTGAVGGTQTGQNWIQLRGEGIGLRIVRKLARLLEARLEVRSETSQGTRFLIYFPRHYADG